VGGSLGSATGLLDQGGTKANSDIFLTFSGPIFSCENVELLIKWNNAIFYRNYICVLIKGLY
jgi:hypothetical protein